MSSIFTNVAPMLGIAPFDGNDITVMPCKKWVKMDEYEGVTNEKNGPVTLPAMGRMVHG